MPQYPTPQFIEQEGKIIYFLTFKQFFLLVGGLSTAIVFYYLLPFYFFVLGSIMVMGIVSVIAFVKIDNTSLVTMFLHFFGFLFENITYMWEKKKSPYPYKSLNQNLHEKEKLTIGEIKENLSSFYDIKIINEMGMCKTVLAINKGENL